MFVQFSLLWRMPSLACSLDIDPFRRREWLECLDAGVATNVAHLSANATMYTADSDSGAFFDDYGNSTRIPQYKRFVMDSPIAEIVAQLLDSTTVRFFHEHLVYKAEGTTVPTPWHQDQSAYALNGKQLCSVWIPLNDIPENESLQFVLGSHKWGRMFMPMQCASQDSSPFVAGSLEPEIPQILPADTTSWAVCRGDAIAFHMMTLHAAGGSKRGRAALSTRWLGDDAAFAQPILAATGSSENEATKATKGSPGLQFSDGLGLGGMSVASFPIAFRATDESAPGADVAHVRCSSGCL